MDIRIYGKLNCALCEAAKDKMKLRGLFFRFYDLEKWSHDWRNTGYVDAMAEYRLTEKLPIIMLDGVCYSYTKAMKELKRREKNNGRNNVSIRTETLPESAKRCELAEGVIDISSVAEVPRKDCVEL